MRIAGLAAGVAALMLLGCGNEQPTDTAKTDEVAPSQSETNAADGPQVSVTADKTHAVQPGDEISLTITVDGFVLDASKIGQANEPGVGHYHIYLDDASGDDYLGVGADSNMKISVPEDITDGTHDVRVVLHNNDHSPGNPPAAGSVALIVYRLD
ncbi:MAG: hypothetical protein OEU36_06720 [Gammaproteobacteria bacterium]|nr:hypothetical protein [Gammaproteobacteria bacterium]